MMRSGSVHLFRLNPIYSTNLQIQVFRLLHQLENTSVQEYNHPFMRGTMSPETPVQVQLIGIVPAETGESGNTLEAEASGRISSLDLFIKETNLAAGWGIMDGFQGLDVVSHEDHCEARWIRHGLQHRCCHGWHCCQCSEDESLDKVHWRKAKYERGECRSRS